jgi:pantetheine hydrolase
LVNVIEIENCSNEQSHCSYDGFNLYNTNLVFDRNGCIISKYRKFNLFNEPLINVTSQPDISTFSTDFGVTFGQFNGFDILFKSPAWDLVNANISHFLYPSMKNSFYPFLTNLQVQQGFAVSNDVVLLSAGGNSPDNSYTGSGIFVGKHGAVQKFISSNSVSKLLVAEIPINVDDSDYQSPEMNSDNSTKIMNRITFINTNDGHFYDLDENLEVHYDEIICKFKVNYTELEIEEDKIGFSYKIVIFNGVKDLMNNEIGEVFCAIVACLDSTCAKLLHENSLNLVPSVKFESIEIEMEIDNYNSDEFLMMPSSLSFGMLPLNKDDFEFSSKENIFETTLTSEIDNLLTFGIYGRNLKLDEKCNDENDENSNEKQDEIIKVSDVHEAVGDLTIKMTVYIVLMIVLSIITTIMVYKKLQQPSFDESITNKRKN